MADTTCDDLELTDYQRLYVAHADTRHQHLHIVVNRIHPETGKAWNRRQDWVRIEQSLADQSRELGLEHVPGRHSAPGEEKPARRRPKDKVFQKTKRLQRDHMLRNWSEERIVREREALCQLVADARSWDELHDGLAERNMLLVRKGQGMVIADVEGAMKLSNLGKGVGRKQLEERFGEDWQAEPDSRGEAFEALAEVNEELEFAFALQRMGLVTKRQIERLMVERVDAQTALNRELTFQERLAREVSEAVRRRSSEERVAETAREKKKTNDRDR